MGDLYARAVEERLNKSQPYPGDTEVYGLEFSRFTAYSFWDERDGSWEGVRVIDHERNITSELYADRLRDPSYTPADQWSMRCAFDASVEDFEDMDYPRIGDVLARTAKEKLTAWVPNESSTQIPRDLWYDVYKHPENPHLYVIEDACRSFKVNIK
ncbi:hypothetical protein V5O48_019440, partial [Marasmius crinis-equi]